MRLIVNADDFGISCGVNYGIIDAHNKGVVTSTTLMVTMPEVDHALRLAQYAPKLGIGLHLNITLGKPITSCPSLLKDDGTFFKPKENPDQSLFIEEEIYQEFLAQYDSFIEKTGKEPTHLDSHLYAHQFYDKAKKAIVRLASEKNVPVRGLQINGFEKAEFIEWFKLQEDDKLMDKTAELFANSHGHDVCELMVHPAYVDEYLFVSSTYNLPRMMELELLTSQAMKQLILKHNIQLIHFGHLRR